MTFLLYSLKRFDNHMEHCVLFTEYFKVGGLISL